MMGTKARLFEPLEQVCLEDLVPKDTFYRHVDRKLDLSFVRDLVRMRYAACGRHSVDPVVFFKLQLVMFFEGIRSERKLIETAIAKIPARSAVDPFTLSAGQSTALSLDAGDRTPIPHNVRT